MYGSGIVTLKERFFSFEKLKISTIFFIYKIIPVFLYMPYSTKIRLTNRRYFHRDEFLRGAILSLYWVWYDGLICSINTMFLLCVVCFTFSCDISFIIKCICEYFLCLTFWFIVKYQKSKKKSIFFHNLVRFISTH